MTYDPNKIYAVETTMEEERHKYLLLEAALRKRFGLCADIDLITWLSPRLKSGEIDEDSQIETWIYLYTVVHEET